LRDNIGSDGILTLFKYIHQAAALKLHLTPPSDYQGLILIHVVINTISTTATNLAITAERLRWTDKYISCSMY